MTATALAQHQPAQRVGHVGALHYHLMILIFFVYINCHFAIFSEIHPLLFGPLHRVHSLPAVVNGLGSVLMLWLRFLFGGGQLASEHLRNALNRIISCTLSIS